MQGYIAQPVIHQCADIDARYSDLSMHLFVPTRNPYVRDFGRVVRDRKLPVWLWNGSHGEASATSTTGGDVEGSITTMTAPVVLPAYSKHLVVMTITADGELEWTTTFTLTSDCPLNSAQVVLTGTRAPAMSGDVGYLMFGHNWEDGLDESLAWKTDIMIAHDRTEQRVQLRTLPRRTWDVRFVLAGAARRKFETWFAMRKTRYFFMPIWRDVDRLAASIAAGSSIIPIEESNDNYVTGGYVALWGAWDQMEIRSITGIGADFLAVDRPFVHEWHPGASFGPGRYCLSLETRRATRFTEDVGDYRLRVTAKDDLWEPDGWVVEQYRDVPICPLTPTWADVDENFDNKWVLLDNDTGLIEFDLHSIEPVLSRDAKFLLIGRPAINTALVFLKSMAGRLTPFWIAANDRAFELSQPAAEGSNLLVITSIDYEYALSGSAARTHIEMVATDGRTIIRRKIIAVETLPTGDEQLTLDSALPISISAETLNRCAWLELVRLNSDEISLHWISSECLEITLPMVVLP